MNYKIQFKSLLFWLVLAVAILVTAQSFAQKTQKHYEPMELYMKAMDLFEKEKYGAAQSAFEDVLEQEEEAHSEMAANASYYRALCGLLLFNTNAENLLTEFVVRYPESPKVNRAYFDLGKYQYRKRRYQKSAAWLEKVDVYNLNNDEIAEYYFKLGYSYFKDDQKKKAIRALYEIKDAETKYSIVAKYYYAHLSYETGNLDAALEYFREIEHESHFAPVIPYYITQILYLKEQYEELISYASAVLDSASAKKAAEISKLIGNAHYRLEQYEASIPYLVKFAKEAREVQFEDYYQVGYACAHVDKHEEAVHWYQRALSIDDSLNQIIQYNMAESYLQLENKVLARNAMRQAYQIGNDADIKENALYAYAKLSYELSAFPYNDAIRAFEEYLNTYPKSKYLEEANEYLVGVYFTTRNYEEARKSLDRIQNRGYKLNLAYQKILYYLGVENMNRALYPQAIAYFDLAIQENYNRNVKVDAFFWKAEAYFRMLKYDISIETFEKFLYEPGAKTSGYYHLAQYNLAYAHYRKRDYDKAIFRFRQFADNGNENVKLKTDALLRVADSYFITKDYKNAVDYYQKASETGIFDQDYALFQGALANGVLGAYDQKISLLAALTEKHDQSLYYDDALYELGDIYLIRENKEKALSSFDQLVSERPESPYFAKAVLKTGLIYFNYQKDTLALEKFKVVVSNYKNTSESKEAVNKIKQIYIDRGDLNGFEHYMASIGIDDIPATSLDSAAYEIAENAYLNNNCEDAVKNFTMYIDRYENGLFLLNAHYYRGECELRSEYTEEALQDFEYVVAQPKNIFTEKALLHAADLSRMSDDKEKALAYYQDLEKKADLAVNRDKAEYWLMSLNGELKNDKQALEYAQKMLNKANLNEDVRNEALLLSGNIYLKQDRYNKAYDHFTLLSSQNNEFGAQGKYQVAYIEYMRGNLDSSEQAIGALLNQVPAYDYWIAKAFILWSDIYLSKEDLYQAKVSLNTVIENYEGEDLVRVAKEKHASIERTEKAAEEKRQENKDEMEIDFNEDENYDYLFEEEMVEDDAPEFVEPVIMEEPVEEVEVTEPENEEMEQEENEQIETEDEGPVSEEPEMNESESEEEVKKVQPEQEIEPELLQDENRAEEQVEIDPSEEASVKLDSGDPNYKSVEE